jgi:hypothetical protein
METGRHNKTDEHASAAVHSCYPITFDILCIFTLITRLGTEEINKSCQTNVTPNKQRRRVIRRNLDTVKNNNEFVDVNHHHYEAGHACPRRSRFSRTFLCAVFLRWLDSWPSCPHRYTRTNFLAFRGRDNAFTSSTPGPVSFRFVSHTLDRPSFPILQSFWAQYHGTVGSCSSFSRNMGQPYPLGH